MRSINKIGNVIAAVFLSVVIIPSIFLSLFVFPVERILFQKDSYTPFLEEKSYRAQMPPVIADVVTNQILLIDGKNLPQVFSNKDAFQSVLIDFLPDGWIDEVLIEMIDNTLAYFNFKTPYSSIEIDISPLKESLVENSASIVNEYVQLLENCSPANMEKIGQAASITDFPSCKPAEGAPSALTSNLSTYIENRTLNLPASINLAGLIPSGFLMGERTFYWYSIIRWVFRLLPYITILILILIAYLLRKNKKQMRFWCGWLLTGVAGATLLGSIIVLVGFNQFTGMIFNRYFSKVIAGFGTVLLGVMQAIGTEVFLWVLGITAVVLLFGLILLLAARFSKPASDTKEKKSDTELAANAENSSKMILPETLEEIEENEKEIDK